MVLKIPYNTLERVNKNQNKEKKEFLPRLLIKLNNPVNLNGWAIVNTIMTERITISIAVIDLVNFLIFSNLTHFLFNLLAISRHSIY